jgi:hypothetical protein
MLTWMLGVLTVEGGAFATKGECMAERQPEVFGWSRLVPEEPDHLFGDPDFEVFYVDVKSDSEFGQEAHHDTLKVLESFDLGIDRDWRVELLRLNAEVPANPVRRSAIWAVNKRTKSAVGVEYKTQKDWAAG